MKSTEIVFILILLTVSYSAFAKDELAYIDSKEFSEIRFYPIKTAPAQVVALATARIHSELVSIVDKVNILAGSRVKKGQVLLRLNCDDYNNRLLELQALKTESTAVLGLKKYQLARTQKLYRSNNISEIDLKTDQANVKIQQARINSIQAKIKLAEKNIVRCHIKAPYNAVVLDRKVNLGEMVAIGQELLTLTDPEQTEVLVQLPIGLVDNIEISSSDFVFQQKKYPVILRAIIPAIEMRARHQQYRFSFLKQNDAQETVHPPLLPNSFGELQVTLEAPYLPANILVKRNQKNGIFILKENTAVFVPVKNAQPGRPFSITLKDVTQVIIEGQQALVDGQKVQQAN